MLLSCAIAFLLEEKFLYTSQVIPNKWGYAQSTGINTSFHSIEIALQNVYNEFAFLPQLSVAAISTYLSILPKHITLLNQQNTYYLIAYKPQIYN